MKACISTIENLFQLKFHLILQLKTGAEVVSADSKTLANTYQKDYYID